jgi:hypothetical protein
MNAPSKTELLNMRIEELYAAADRLTDSASSLVQRAEAQSAIAEWPHGHVLLFRAQKKLDRAKESLAMAGTLIDCCKAVRICRVCGCTEQDCRQCIEKTGKPCNWVEDDLCSACVKPAPLKARRTS